MTEFMSINVRTLAGEKNRKGWKKAMISEKIILSDAGKAVRYDAKLRQAGGFALKHRPSCCGVALKWLIGVRKITYAQFAKEFNNTTAQNLNNMINRVDKSRFFEEDIEKMCKILKIKPEYFTKLCDAIENIMENTDGETGR